VNRHAAPITPQGRCPNFLSTQAVKDGETVEYGWFIFKVTTDAGKTDLQTLDFRAMASFTSDFSAPERIHQAQHATLAQEGVAPSPCTLRHAAGRFGGTLSPVSLPLP
jgi:hypothetical protein